MSRDSYAYVGASIREAQARAIERAAGNTTVLTHITRPDGSLAPYIAANLGGVITTTRKRIAKLEGGR